MDRDSLPPNIDKILDDESSREDYARLWALLQRTDEDRAASFDVDDSWAELADRLDLDAASDDESAEVPTAPDRRAADRTSRASARSSSRRRWGRVVSTVALVLLLVGGGLWWWSQPVSVATAAGEQTTVTLPDGSTVELNGATTLTYAPGFSSLPLVGSSGRRVRLEGEAFFSVVKRDRPFSVNTPNARIEVVGTTFDVRVRTRHDTLETRVAVTSGRVQMTATPRSGTGSADAAVLGPGQASRVSGFGGRPTSPRPIDLKYVKAWRQGGFAISGASVPTILRELEHRFGTSLRLRAPVAATDTMTLHYARNARLENILRDICLIQGLSYRKTSRGYELVRD